MPLICQTLFYMIWICMSMRQAKFSAPVWGIHSQPTPHFQNPFISPNSELQCSVVHTGLLLLQLFAHTLFGLFSKESLILCLPVSKLGSFHDLFNSFCTLRLILYSWLFQGIQEGERGNFVSNIPPWLEAAVSNFTQRAHHLSIWRPVMHLAFGQPPPSLNSWESGSSSARSHFCIQYVSSPYYSSQGSSVLRQDCYSFSGHSTRDPDF